LNRIANGIAVAQGSVPIHDYAPGEAVPDHQRSSVERQLSGWRDRSAVEPSIAIERQAPLVDFEVTPFGMGSAPKTTVAVEGHLRTEPDEYTALHIDAAVVQDDCPELVERAIILIRNPEADTCAPIADQLIVTTGRNEYLANVTIDHNRAKPG